MNDSAATPSPIVSGHLPRVIILLAMPVLLENTLTFFVGFYDVFLSGKLSEHAVHATKAIGVASYVGWLASLMFGLVGTGTTALIARQFGSGQFAEANRFFNRSIALAFFLSLFVATAFWTLAPVLASLLNMHEEAYDIAVRYLHRDAFGHFFSGFTFIGAAALRGAGNMRLPMYILGFVNVINMTVSTLLVFGIGPWPAIGLETQLVAGWGVDGIVTGTVTAKFCGAAIMLLCLAQGVNHLKLDRREFRVRDESVRRILRIGSLAAVDGAIMWIGQFLFLMIIANLEANQTDSYVFAAHIVGINIESISYLPSIAWGLAAATVVGQSLGAGNRDRAMAAGNAAIGQCVLLLLVVSLTFYFGAEQIFAFMQKERRVIDVGVPAFRWLALFQIPLGIEIIYKASLRGAGDTRYPMYFTALGVLGVRVPLAYLGGIVLHGGLVGAWAGMFADVSLRAVLHSIRYLRGRWTEISV